MRGEVVSHADSTLKPLPLGRKYIQINLLTAEQIFLAVEIKRCTINDICIHVGDILSIEDKHLFGIALLVGGEYRFLEPDTRLIKHTPKGWKSGTAKETDNSGNLLVIFHYRVKIYVNSIHLISGPVCLHHYYLQFRQNVRNQWDSQAIPEEKAFELAALALHVDFGDNITSASCSTSYFRPEQYFPMCIINNHGMDYLYRHLPSMHRGLAGMEQSDAKQRYVAEISHLASTLTVHLYGLRRAKTASEDTLALGVSMCGLEIYDVVENERFQIAAFPWCRIGKVSFERRKFSLSSVDGQRFLFFCSSEDKAKYLLQFCRSLHRSVMRLQPLIAQARSTEQQELQRYRESYIYSDSADLECMKQLCSLSRGFDCSGQRVSVVSDASSNTTSGIVSDKQQAHEESEVDPDDSDRETNIVDSALSLDGPYGGRGSTDILVDYHISDDMINVSETTPRFRCNSIDYGRFVRSGSMDSVSPFTYGPCSDRTTGHLSSEDAQSESTTATMGKLDDVNDPECSTLEAEETSSVSQGDASRKLSTCSSCPSDHPRGFRYSPVASSIASDTGWTSYTVNATLKPSPAAAVTVVTVGQSPTATLDRPIHTQAISAMSPHATPSFHADACSIENTKRWDFGSGRVDISVLRQQTLSGCHPSRSFDEGGHRESTTSQSSLSVGGLPLIASPHLDKIASSAAAILMSDPPGDSRRCRSNPGHGKPFSKIMKSLATQTGASLASRMRAGRQLRPCIATQRAKPTTSDISSAAVTNGQGVGSPTRPPSVSEKISNCERGSSSASTKTSVRSKGVSSVQPTVPNAAPRQTNGPTLAIPQGVTRASIGSTNTEIGSGPTVKSSESGCAAPVVSESVKSDGVQQPPMVAFVTRCGGNHAQSTGRVYVPGRSSLNRQLRSDPDGTAVSSAFLSAGQLGSRMTEIQQANSEPGLNSLYHESLCSFIQPLGREGALRNHQEQSRYGGELRGFNEINNCAIRSNAEPALLPRLTPPTSGYRNRGGASHLTQAGKCPSALELASSSRRIYDVQSRSRIKPPPSPTSRVAAALSSGDRAVIDYIKRCLQHGVDPATVLSAASGGLSSGRNNPSKAPSPPYSQSSTKATSQQMLTSVSASRQLLSPSSAIHATRASPTSGAVSVSRTRSMPEYARAHLNSRIRAGAEGARKDSSGLHQRRSQLPGNATSCGSVANQGGGIGSALSSSGRAQRSSILGPSGSHQQTPLSTPLDTTVSSPSSHQQQCSCCYEDHSLQGNIDIDKLKGFCENMNLPFLKALCDDTSPLPPNPQRHDNPQEKLTAVSCSSILERDPWHSRIGVNRPSSTLVTSDINPLPSPDSLTVPLNAAFGGVRPTSWHETQLCGHQSILGGGIESHQYDYVSQLLSENQRLRPPPNHYYSPRKASSPTRSRPGHGRSRALRPAIISDDVPHPTVTDSFSSDNLWRLLHDLGFSLSAEGNPYAINPPHPSPPVRFSSQPNLFFSSSEPDRGLPPPPPYPFSSGQPFPERQGQIVAS